MYRLRPRGLHQVPFVFTESEIEQLEKLFQETEDESFNSIFYQKVAEKLNRASGRAGKAAIQWTKVQNWFQTKLKTHSATVAPMPIVSKDLALIQYACLSDSAPESSMPEGEKAQDLSDLQFEARSSKDGAWYDVATFLTHRVHSSGEPEVRVRFVGFGAEEDEWVNIKNAVRERSLPLEPSECWKVKAGDLILCFQERKDQAYYFDAHVVKVEKKLHDARGCRCLFWVRYDHDHSEEKVNLRKVCCRPFYRP